MVKKIIKLCRKHATPDHICELLGIERAELAKISDLIVENVGANWDACEYCKKYPKKRGDIANA